MGVLEWAGGVVPQGALVRTAKAGWRGTWAAMVAELAPQDASGGYQRPVAGFLAADFRPGGVGSTSGALPEEYVLYVGNACPWCHRVRLAHALRGLEGRVRLVEMADDAERASRGGWVFGAPGEPDPLVGAADLRELYDTVRPGYVGRCTAPLLLHGPSRQAVSNDSLDILRFLNGLDGASRPRVDLFPSGSEAALEESIDFVYDRINNGVYRCGFATSQGAYDHALEELFAALDATEERLAGRRFLLGPHLTAADLCLLPTALRFEAVYAVLFRCCARPLGAYPHLLRWRRECWGVEGVASTFDLPAAMRSYYGQLFPLNPSGIVPPRPTLEELGLPPEPPELSQPEDVAALCKADGGESERFN